jgi:hypothetical protein
MQGFLRQSTAVSVKFGPFVDDTDGKTPETGLTLTKTDLLLAKNGGAAAAVNRTQGSAPAYQCVHDTGGEYIVEFDTTDTNTAGIAKLICEESGALPVWESWVVLPQPVYDALVAGAATVGIPADLTGAHGTALTEGAHGRLAAALVKLFDVAAPTAMADDLAAETAVDALSLLVADVLERTDRLPDAPAGVGDIAPEVLGAAAESYNSPGTIGEKINDAGESTDPLESEVPGAYLEGTAGYNLGNMPAPGVSIISGNYNPIGSKFALGIVRGDDNPFTWQLLAGATAINLTGATVTFVAAEEDVEGAAALWEWEGDVTDDPTNGYVTFSPESSDTTAAGLEIGRRYPAYIQIEHSGGQIQTLLGTAEIAGAYVSAASP